MPGLKERAGEVLSHGRTSRDWTHGIFSRAFWSRVCFFIIIRAELVRKSFFLFWVLVFCFFFLLLETTQKRQTKILMARFKFLKLYFLKICDFFKTFLNRGFVFHCFFDIFDEKPRMFFVLFYFCLFSVGR